MTDSRRKRIEEAASACVDFHLRVYGENIKVLTPAGNFVTGFHIGAQWSDANPAPAKEAEEAAEKYATTVALDLDTDTLLSNAFLAGDANGARRERERILHLVRNARISGEGREDLIESILKGGE